MSYLSPLRLHFAGQFQAAVSTVNNDSVHYDNATFQSSYQESKTDSINWNPHGNGAWRLIGCQVTSAFLDGLAVDQTDQILACIVADADRQTTAKLVDLDPQQQMVSQIWGLEVRICDRQGNTLVRGQFEPAAFMDIWQNCALAQGSSALSAMYQSVLTDLNWGDLSRSPFLQALQHQSPDRLSIKFNVDGMNMTSDSPEFTLGRLVGTIGPSAAHEPQHFVLGRQLLPQNLPVTSISPPNNINFCVAVLDEERGKVYLDLGNALPTVSLQGPRQSLGALAFGTLFQNNFSTVDYVLDSVYTAPRWYETTAGVIELPANRPLTPSEIGGLKATPMAIQILGAGGQLVIAVAEDASGNHVRADQFVFRLNPGEAAEVKLYATTFGQPYADARIISILDSSQLQQIQTGILLDQIYSPPPVATPTSAISFPSLVVTGKDGTAVLTINTSDPGNPRGYIDGQVYGVRPMLEESLIPGCNYQFNGANFVSLLLWDTFQPTDPPTWWGTSDKDSLQAVFQQYANLYPVMRDFLDLSDYDSVCAHLGLLKLAFGLDPSNPNSMPVTRDLSTTKRRAILRWMENLGPDNKPLLGDKRDLREEQSPRLPNVLIQKRSDTVDGSKISALASRLGLERL